MPSAWDEAADFVSVGALRADAAEPSVRRDEDARRGIVAELAELHAAGIHF
jgi:hypothetical protein